MITIHPISDLHLEWGPFNHPFPKADVLFLSGDICVAQLLHPKMNDANARSHKKACRKFFDLAASSYEKIFYVPGNHESYHGDLINTIPILREFLKPYPNITVGDQFSEIYKGVLFLGTTLWTDFNNGNPVSMLAAANGMNDYRVIRDDNQKFTPDRALVLFQENCTFLMNEIGKNHEPTIVMTHMAPSRKSTHEWYKDEYHLNGAFSSNVEHLMQDHVKLWSHGHCHNEFDYTIGETRVICNPRGYYQTPDENKDFKDDLVIEIKTGGKDD